MAAIVLGAITQLSDKTPWLAAIFADRFRSPALVVLAAVLALVFNYAIGVAAGLAVAALLTPEARLLLLALALVLAGAGTGFRFRRPDALEGWRTGPAFTSIAGLAIMAFGDRMQFVVAALAARSSLPWAAMVGAVIGAAAVNIVAVALGEAAWLRLPLKSLRIAAAAILLVAGAVIGVNALQLV
jgi:putative Ca2+/H+ antiporter (TMEM165/GDT1 family)